MTWDLRTVLVVYLSVPLLLKSSYRLYPLMYIKMLETVCIPPLTSLICEIKTLLILLKYQVILVIAYIFIIKVINYAHWHTFESKRYMYFHNKTWYTCTFLYPLLHVVYMTRIDYNALLTPLIAKACVVQWIGCRTPDSGADGSNHGVGRFFFLFSLPNVFKLLFIFSLGFLYVLFVSVR